MNKTFESCGHSGSTQPGAQRTRVKLNELNGTVMISRHQTQKTVAPLAANAVSKTNSWPIRSSFHNSEAAEFSVESRDLSLSQKMWTPTSHRGEEMMRTLSLFRSNRNFVHHPQFDLRFDKEVTSA